MEQIMERDIEGTHNRNLTIDWAMGNDMVCTNTYFEKNPSKLITFKIKSAPEDYDVWEDNEVYAQIDFIWINDRWKRAITNVETDSNSRFPSDHYPLTAEINLKLQKKKIKNLRLLAQNGDLSINPTTRKKLLKEMKN